MAMTTGAFPYDIANLLGGAVRILRAPATTAVPTSIDDVIDMTTPYASKNDWDDVGATSESFTYSRGFDTEGWEIQQLRGNVIEEITDITRSIEVSFADFRPEHLQMFENAPSVGDVAAIAGSSAQKRVGFGSFSSVDQYRFAFIAMRPKQAGVVVEPTGTPPLTRGRFFMGVAYRAQLAADDISLEMAKGALTAAGVTFNLFPEDTVLVPGETFGAWYDEQAGTIAGA